MALTDRDCELIHMVNACRMLTGDQLQALFFSSRSTAQYRLQRLFQHEYLERHFQAVVAAAPAAAPAIYTLGKRGAHVLVERFGFDRSDIKLPRRAALGWHTVEHTLRINDVRIAILLAAQEHDWQLLEWRDEGRFRAEPDYVLLTDGKGRQRQKPVLPDGYFCLETPRGKARFFLEVDRGTEQLSKFAPQIAVYEAYTHSGQYQARFRARSLRVLVVTTSAKRMDSLKRVARDEGGDRKYWFTTLGQVSAQTVLTEPIWEQLANSQKKKLVY